MNISAHVMVARIISFRSSSEEPLHSRAIGPGPTPWTPIHLIDTQRPARHHPWHSSFTPISIHAYTTLGSKPGPFNNLGDKEIPQILKFTMFRSQRHFRLVNKRLARLALPLSLRTLVICSPKSLEHLIHFPNGPLFNGDLSNHVLCLGICFVPHDFVINSEDLAGICPNLIVVRFHFDLGG